MVTKTRLKMQTLNTLNNNGYMCRLVSVSSSRIYPTYLVHCNYYDFLKKKSSVYEIVYTVPFVARFRNSTVAFVAKNIEKKIACLL